MLSFWVLLASIQVSAINYPTYKPRYSASPYGVRYVPLPQQQMQSVYAAQSTSGTGYQSAVYAPFSSSAPTNSAPRRILGNRDGSYDGEINGSQIWDDGEWVPLEVGMTRIENGVVHVWNGTSWVTMNDQEGPDSPVGDTPWWLMLALLAGYGIYRRRVGRVTQD